MSLNYELFPRTSIDYIEYLYHNFTMVLSCSINKLSIKVSSKKKNRRTNPSYDKECKIARISINEVIEEPLKFDKINGYKALFKIKNALYK